MIANYLIRDNLGNIASSEDTSTIPITQGEGRTITVYLFNTDGTPLMFTGTVSTFVAKIFSQIAQASIQKTLAASTLAVISKAGAVTSNVIGFQFTLQPADTSSMAPNNAGLPMTATIVDTSGNTLELDFPSVFEVTVPVVTT